MKKVSFIAVIHFLTGATFEVNAEGVTVPTGGELAYQSVGNKFTLSRMYKSLNEEIRNLNRNIFTTITGRIADMFHKDKEMCSATRSSGYKSAKIADKLFNLHLTITIDDIVQTYILEGVQLAKDPLGTAGNIYSAMVESLTGESNVFNTRENRTENLELLQFMLQPFGVKADDVKFERSDVLVQAINDQVKTVNTYRRAKLANMALNSGTADLKKATKLLKEENLLLEGKSPIPAAEKKAIADAVVAEVKVEVPADAVEA